MSSDQSIYQRPTQPARRVVVTGIGAVTPVGLNASESWDSLVNGRSGISKISAFDASEMNVQIAGEVKGFDPDKYIDKKSQKKMDRFIHLSMASSKMAIEDSGLTFDSEALRDRTGVLVGVGIGGLPMIQSQAKTLFDRGPNRISPFFIPSVISNLASGQISILTGARGPNFSVTSACASGSHSIGEATEYIRRGVCDVMVAGGSEAAICDLAIAGFSSMRALSTRNDHPEMASRPWDKDRDGFVLAEASGMLILEDYEHAAKRGARIYAEVSGYGVSSDAYHMTSPPAGGAGAALAMQNALNDARLNAEDIDYINAHGTSTPVGDEIESDAVKSVFGSHAKDLWVSSTKSMTGHSLGAAGAIESVFSIQTLINNLVPPTINLEHPSESCDLDYVPGAAREKQLKHVLNNSFGFGGTNTGLVFSKI